MSNKWKFGYLERFLAYVSTWNGYFGKWPSLKWFHMISPNCKFKSQIQCTTVRPYLFFFMFKWNSWLSSQLFWPNISIPFLFLEINHVPCDFLALSSFFSTTKKNPRIYFKEQSMRTCIHLKLYQLNEEKERRLKANTIRHKKKNIITAECFV